MEKGKSIFFRILLLIGCSIFFYPTISNYVNNITQTRAIIEYQEALSKFHSVDIKAIKDKADRYNEKLTKIQNPLSNPEALKGYKENLDPFKTGIMGSLIVEKINVNLPIYHNVNEGVIQVGVGHLPGTSLPVGGKSTHAVISTHRGLPSAKLFTDLNKLKVGDEFIISVLDKNLTYRIKEIITVLPSELNALRIEKGKDYVTMFTCTPYGINSHRLLVKGERVFKNTKEEKQKVEKKAKRNLIINILKIVTIVGIFSFILILIIKDAIFIIANRKK